MTATIFIDGQAGTTGLGIAERLAGIPGIHLLELDAACRKSPIQRQQAMREADLAILCLPDDAARESVTLADALGEHGPKLLDASTAHRTAPGWTYGFAELTLTQRARIAQSTRVANPGCYATGAIALLHPLISAGLLSPATALTINAVSGYSGGGRTMIADHERSGGPAFELYALGLAHKHLPEIVALSGLVRAPIFVPSVAHLAQGMLVSIPLHLEAFRPQTVTQHVHDAIAAHYPPTGQVRVIPADPLHTIRPDTLNGTDILELAVYGNHVAALLVARLDNLGKGASGAAVQNARLMLGLEPP